MKILSSLDTQAVKGALKKFCGHLWYLSEDIAYFLSQINWFYEFSFCQTADDMYNVFLCKINHAINLFVPLDRMKRKGRPALPKHIKKLLNKRKQLWIKMKKNATTKNKQKFKEIKKQCRTVLITNEADRVKKLIRNVDRSGFYRYVNKTMGQPRIPVLLKHKQTREILNNKDCVEQYAKFF